MKRPLVFTVAMLSAGIACGFFFQSVLAALLIAVSVLAVACFLLKQKWWVFLLATAFFVAGLCGAMLHVWSRPDLPYSTRMIVEGRVLSIPKEYEKHNKLVLKSESTQLLNEAGEIESFERPLYFELSYVPTEESVSIGDSLRVYGYFLRNRERMRICGSLSEERVELLENRFDNAFVRFSHSCADWLNTHIRKHYSGQTGALLAAILTGDQSGISKETKENFKRAGLTHLIAVSGMNISILIFFFTALAFFIPRRWRLALSLPLLLFLVIFTGAPPSILRAAAMSAIFLLADLQGRDSDGLTNLFFAAGVLLLMDYDILYDISFQLSFLSVLGLILGMPLLKHPFFQNRFGKLLGTTIMAQLGALPVTVAVFGKLYPYATFTNLLVVPLFPLTIGVCLAVLILLVLIPPLGRLVLPVSAALVNAYLWVTEKIGSLPGAVVDVTNVAGEIGVFLACALAAGYLLLKLRKE